MKNLDFDAYIDKSPDYAKPILRKIRQLFHKACPKIVETMKWNFPHFEHEGVVAGVAAFKQHMSFGFWKWKLMKDPEKIFANGEVTKMEGIKITQLADLPSDKVLLAYIREAVELNDQGVKVPKSNKPRKALPVPDYFMEALRKHPKARTTFEGFSPSNQRDYVEWITEARQEETRAKRLATSLEWLAEGKPRNWKYMKGKKS